MAAYQDAMACEVPKPAPNGRHIEPGTIASLVHSYLNSVAFGELAPETKRTRKNILRRFGDEHGDKRAAMLKREHIVAMFTKISGKRFAARNWLKTVRALMQFAISDGSLKEDPTAGIKEHIRQDRRLPQLERRRHCRL
jgi:site-specific recombinase XerC